MTLLNTICDELARRSLLTDDIKDALTQVLLHRKNNSVKMTWGKHKGRTLNEIYEFDPKYITWLTKQAFIKEKFSDIYGEASTY